MVPMKQGRDFFCANFSKSNLAAITPVSRMPVNNLLGLSLWNNIKFGDTAIYGKPFGQHYFHASSKHRQIGMRQTPILRSSRLCDLFMTRENRRRKERCHSNWRDNGK